MLISYGSTIFDDVTGDVFEVEEREREEIEYDPSEKLDCDYDAERDEFEFWAKLAEEEAAEDERLLKEYEEKYGKLE